MTASAEMKIGEDPQRALSAKATELDCTRGIEPGTAEREALVAASLRCGRLTGSARDLSAGEAAAVLEWLEEELAIARRV